MAQHSIDGIAGSDDWLKFNDPNGTSEQNTCETACDFSKGNDPVGRADSDEDPFDVYYAEEDGTKVLKSCLGKCVSCPHWNTFLSE